MSALREAPFRASLYREATILGGERGPMALVILASLALVALGMTWVTTVIGLLVGAIGIGGLRRASRVHPRICRVYLRSLRHRPYYPARLAYLPPRPRRTLYARIRRELL